MDIEIQNLIDKNAEDEILLKFINHIPEKPEIFEMRESDTSDGSVLQFKKTGLQITFDQQHKVNTIHVFAENIDKYQQYPYPLPKGLSFNVNRDEAIAILGQPSVTGGPVKAVINKSIFFWDRWDNENFSLHLQYPEDKNSISMLTLIRPNRLPK